MSGELIDYIYQNFSMNFPFIEREVVNWKPYNKKSIIAELSNGSLVEYNDRYSTIRTVKEYDGSKELWKIEFANKLLDSIYDAGYDQSSFANASGIPQPYISNYIRGKTIPSGYVIKQMADTLGCPASKLIDFDIFEE